MRATVLIGVFVVGAALVLPVASLAEMTSIVLLSVFAVVNLSLIMLKRQKAEAPFRVPDWVPYVGLAAALLALATSLIGGSG